MQDRLDALKIFAKSSTAARPPEHAATSDVAARETRRGREARIQSLPGSADGPGGHGSAAQSPDLVSSGSERSTRR